MVHCPGSHPGCVCRGWCFGAGLPVWSEFYAKSAPPDEVTVEITGEQFAWNVRYPGADGIFGRSDPGLISLSNPLGLDQKDSAARDDVVLLGEVQLPLNRPARLRLRSKGSRDPGGRSPKLLHHQLSFGCGPDQTGALVTLEPRSCLNCFLAFTRNPGDHCQRCNRIGPPPTPERIETQANQKSYR